MLPAFQRLAVGLQAVAQLVQQPVHRPFADTVTGTCQFRRQACRAAAGPQQRPHRVAAGDRIDQPLQLLRQALVVCSQSLASRPAPAHAHGLGSCPSGLLASEFFQTGANGRPRHTGGCGYAGYPATPDTACFDCRPAAPQAFVEQRIKGDKLGLDGFGQGEVHHEAAVYHTSQTHHSILARRQALEAGFRALIERHEHPRRDLMEWLLGQALAHALEQNSERIGSLLPKLWNIVKYDILVGSSFVEQLRDLLCRSASARSLIVDIVESRINDINADPGLGVAFAHDRDELRQVVDAWRAKPSTDRLREHLFTNYEDDLLSIVPGILPAARTEIIDRLDRLNFPHPIQQILFRTSITHDRDEIAAILDSAPACSDDGRSWNHRLLALLVLKAVDDHCDALWRSVYRADNSGRTELQAIKEVKATLLPWFKQLGSIVMIRTDARFLGPQWLFMKIADERLHRAHYGIERQRSAGGIPQAELIEWIALGLANAGLTASLIADRIDFSALPPGGKIAPSRPTSRDHAHDPRLSALFAMCLVDHVSDSSRNDAERERLCLLDRMLASRDSGFEAEANIDAGVDSLPASYFGYLVANVAKPAERWRQSWDLLVEQRRRVQHWKNTTDSDGLAPSLFLLAIGISGVGWLLSTPDAFR